MAWTHGLNNLELKVIYSMLGPLAMVKVDKNVWPKKDMAILWCGRSSAIALKDFVIIKM